MLVLTLAAVAALAQTPDFSWSGTIASGKRLTVKNIVGDVTVEPASGREASVTAVKREGRRGDPEDVEIRQIEDGDGITICVIYPSNNSDSCDYDGVRRSRRDRDRDDDDRGRRRGSWRNENDTRVSFTVRVPAGTKLSVGTVSGDVSGRGLRGDTEARSVSGDVDLTDVEAGTVEAQSVSGNITLERVNADVVGAETVSGDVEFSGEIRARGEYDLKTLSGDILMRIPRGAGAQVRGSTFSGEFISSFEITTRASGRFMRRERIDGQIGDGSARINVESFSGDVELRELGRGA